ncbi:MAG TPA: hypothetical protein DIT04_06455 [Dysgonomonas sp.]|nr:hypothetical protein [Dysgonomonas sp.]
MKNLEDLIDKNFWKISLLFILICSGVVIYFCFIRVSIWYDEAYTIAMVKYPFADIITITSWDVHPPLYYLLLKFFTNVTGSNSIIAMRIFSYLGIMAAFLIGLFPIRRLFGKTTALLFIAALSLMPVNQYMGTEIRMYSWAMFFVLACAVYAYDCFKNEKPLSYILVTLFAVCGAYTHNYALIAVGIIYGLLITAYLMTNRKIIKVIFSLAAFIVLYSPWIPAILGQVGRVKQDYWIGGVTPRDILLYSYYFFSPKEPSHPYITFSLPPMAIGLSIMLLLIGILFFLIIKKHKKKHLLENLFAGDAFVLVYVLTLVSSIFFSILFKPILVARYTICVLGPLLLGTSIYASLMIGSKYKIIIMSSLSMLLIFTLARISSETSFYNKQTEYKTQLATFINEEGSPSYIISTPESFSLLAEISIMFPHKKPIVYSPYRYTDYTPFTLGVIKFIPDSLTFFHVESLVVGKDSVQIDRNYLIQTELSFPRFNIYLKGK